MAPRLVFDQMAASIPEIMDGSLYFAVFSPDCKKKS
jgi:hypothetical protein